MKRLMLVNSPFYADPAAITTHTTECLFAPFSFSHQFNPKRAALFLDAMLLIDADT